MTKHITSNRFKCIFYCSYILWNCSIRLCTSFFITLKSYPLLAMDPGLAIAFNKILSNMIIWTWFPFQFLTIFIIIVENSNSPIKKYYLFSNFFEVLKFLAITHIMCVMIFSQKKSFLTIVIIIFQSCLFALPVWWFQNRDDRVLI